MTKDQALDWIDKTGANRELNSKAGEGTTREERIAGMRWTATLKLGPNSVSINGSGAAPKDDILFPFLVGYFIQWHGDQGHKP